MKVKKITIGERVAEELVSLKPSVTTDDRLAYRAENTISAGNLSLYLNGTIYNLEKALGMIEFFKKRIAEREKKAEKLLTK